MLLLDTQTLVWFSSGDRKLGEAARQHVLEAGSRAELAVSPISFWEIGMLVSKGKLRLPVSASAWTAEICGSDNSPQIAELTPEIAASAGQLPWDVHGDPADRIIIATARALAAPILTSDGKMLDYARAGHIQAIDARR